MHELLLENSFKSSSSLFLAPSQRAPSSAPERLSHDWVRSSAASLAADFSSVVRRPTICGRRTCLGPGKGRSSSDLRMSYGQPPCTSQRNTWALPLWRSTMSSRYIQRLDNIYQCITSGGNRNRFIEELWAMQQTQTLAIGEFFVELMARSLTLLRLFCHLATQEWYYPLS